MMRRKADIRMENDVETQSKKVSRLLDAFSNITESRKENAGVKRNANPRSMIASHEDSVSDAVYDGRRYCKYEIR